MKRRFNSEGNIINPVKSEILFSKIITKYDKTGMYKTGSLKIEVKKLLQAKFIQLTQEKIGYAGAPSKISSVTLDFSSNEVRDNVLEAIEFYDNYLKN
ncbi:MAG: hypothetical protein ACP5OG_01665 [Candidatus Nanoarchaeia archaeon]